MHIGLQHGVADFIWGLSLIQAGFFIVTAVRGRQLQQQRARYGASSENDKVRHERLGKRSLFAMAVIVAIIDTAIHSLKLPYSPFFKWVHAPILVFLVFFLALTFVFNGRKDPARHAIFAPLAVLFVIAATITGDILVYQLIWLHYPTVLH